MEMFQTVQKYFTILGLSSSTQSTQKWPFNERVLLGFICVYIFEVERDFMEYVECICAASASIIIFVCLVAIVFWQTTIFELIDFSEQVLN